MARPTALYRISDTVKQELPDLIKMKVNAGIRDFVIALVNVATTANHNTINRKTLNDALSSYYVKRTPTAEAKPLSTSNGVVSNRMKELQALGCLVTQTEYLTIDGKKRNCNVNNLISLQGLIKHLKNSPNRSPAPAGRPKLNDLVVYSEALENSELMRLDASGDVVPYTETAFSILEAAARSRSDKEKVIHCKYHLRKDDVVEIVAATSTKEGSGIMYSSDQRVIHTLNGMLRQANESFKGDLLDDDMLPAKLIGEYCFFDIYALTKEIGLQANSAINRQSVFKMIERLKDTTFSVDASNSKLWRELYMPDSGLSKGEYRYITEFYSGGDWVQKKGLHEKSDLPELPDRYYVVRFHPLVLRAMTTPRLAYIAHESLKRERLDIVHRLNNWVKPVVGVRPRNPPVPKDHYQYTLDIFQQRVKPSSRLDNFIRQFYHMVKRQDELEGDVREECKDHRFQYDEDMNLIPNGVFWLNGYYYKLEMSEELAQEVYRRKRAVQRRRRKLYPVITIWRDPKDEIVGDSSDHNLALRRQMSELLASSKPTRTTVAYAGAADDIFTDL